MPGDCVIRALWILNNLNAVVFSRRFLVIERQWHASFKSENESSNEDSVKYSVYPILPNDSDLAAAFVERKKREGSTRGYGIRMTQSANGSDSWVDDPIMCHVISLHINLEEGESHLLWPLVLHVRGPYCILILPLVEPRHLKAYSRLCRRSDCGSAVGVDESISPVLLDLPSITGYGDVFYANWDDVLPGATAVVSTSGGFGSEEKMLRINGEANVVAVNAAKDYGQQTSLVMIWC